MEHLFEALQNKYPGHEVVDVQFTVLNRGEKTFFDIETFDIELAKAIDEAEEVPFDEMVRMFSN